MNAQGEAASIETSSERLRELAQRADCIHLIATNPVAPEDTLRDLSQSGDPKVRRAVAANPNTPSEIVFQLADTYVDAFLANPVVPLLVIAQPDCVKQLNWKTQLTIARREEADPIILRALLAYGHPMVWDEIAHHVALAGEVRENWQRLALEALSHVISEEDLTRIPCWTLPGLLSAATLRELARLPYYARIALESPDCPPDVLQTYERSDHATIRRIVARHPMSPSEILARLAQDADLDVRRAVAANPAAPLSALERLVFDSDQEVRVQVAAHPALSMRLLQVIATDTDEVRLALAQRSALPSALVAQLGRDASNQVRLVMAKRPDATADLLMALACDPCPEIRAAAAHHQRLPHEGFARLSADRNASVEVGLAASRFAQPELITRSAHGGYVAMMQAAAANPYLPRAAIMEILERLTKDADPQLSPGEVALAEGLACNPSTPPSALRALTSLNDPRVRRAVARHPATPGNALEVMAHDVEASATWRDIARHPRTPLACLENLAAEHDLPLCRIVAAHPSLTAIRRLRIYRIFFRSLLQYLASSRALIAGERQSLPLAQLIAVLAGLEIPDIGTKVQSDTWTSRWFAACHGRTPTNFLQQLAHDGNRFVRAAARAHLAQRERGACWSVFTGGAE